MKRSQAQAAIDDAFADGLKGLFNVLERGMFSVEPEDRKLARKKFREGIARYDEAHSAAGAEIDKIFLES